MTLPSTPIDQKWRLPTLICIKRMPTNAVIFGRWKRPMGDLEPFKHAPLRAARISSRDGNTIFLHKRDRRET